MIVPPDTLAALLADAPDDEVPGIPSLARLAQAFDDHAAPSQIHGPAHVLRVLSNGLRLAAASPGTDVAVVVAFALIHDAAREDDGPNPDHGRRAASLARLLRAAWIITLDDDQMRVLCIALAHHADGNTCVDPTIGVSWDADRLDLPRVGVTVDPAYLSTPAARQVVIAA